MKPTSSEKMKCDYSMINYAPKVMIYRVGKYTPYKGHTQEIEMMLKIINNEEETVKIGFSEYEDMNLKNPQDAHDGKEISNIDKIELIQKLNTMIELPQGKISLDLKNRIDKDA